jgi:MFS family permease
MEQQHRPIWQKALEFLERKVHRTYRDLWQMHPEQLPSLHRGCLICQQGKDFEHVHINSGVFPESLSLISDIFHPNFRFYSAEEQSSHTAKLNMAGPDRDPDTDLPKDGKINALQSDIPSIDKDSHSLEPVLGTAHLIKDDGRIILVPTPSRDPADPLNWSPRRKWTILGLLVLWSATALSVQNFLSNFLPSVYTRFPDATTNQINLLLTISTALVAPGQLVFVPLALTYGRRFSLLLSITLLLASTTWGACSTSYGSLLGARIVEGFAGGPTDAMGFTIIQEFSFVHERGRMLGVLMMGQLALQLVFAIATNYMAVSTGFKWPFVLFSCISAGTFIGLWIFMPETRYERRSGQNNLEIALKEHTAIRKTLNSTGEFPHFGLKRQMSFWVGKGSGPDRDFFLIFRRMGTMLLHPVVWWSALLNAVITGYVLPFLVRSSN